MVLKKAAMNTIAMLFEGQYILTYFALWYLAIHLLTQAANFVSWPIVIATITLVYRYWWCENLNAACDTKNEDYHAVIIGGGFAGICAAVRLKLKGVSFIVIEKSSNVGGTWFHSVYPESGCDTMSHMYQYSFHPNPFWTRFLVGSQEILNYLNNTCDIFHVRDNFRFNTTVQRCVFDRTSNKWQVHLSELSSESSMIECDFVISAVGAIHVPKIPNFAGLEDFRGEVFHTSQWKKDFDCRNKRIALIGTGCSGIQVMPHIAKRSGDLFVFQRSAAYVLPTFNFEFPRLTRKIFRLFPFAMTIQRWYSFVRLEMIYFLALRRNSITNSLLQFIAKLLIQSQVTDPVLKEKLTPNYTLGSKRIAISTDYIQSFNKCHVTLNNQSITRITKDSILTADGNNTKVDAIIFATGFDTLKSIAGGIRVERPSDNKTLSEVWGDTPESYLGTMNPGFPNFFTLLGPGTELGKNFTLTNDINFETSISSIVDRMGFETFSLVNL